jgi:hypothetical protein
MSKLHFVALATFLLTGLGSCTKIEDPKEPVVNPILNPWKKVDFVSEGLLQNALASTDQLFVISRDKFFRFDKSRTLLEKRLLPVSNDYGTASLSFNMFARVVKNSSGRFLIEFHLVKTPGEIVSISTEDLKKTANEIVKLDYFGREIGAFNPDGTKFLIAAQTFPNYFYTFYLFDVKLDPTTFHFATVTLSKRIEVPQMSTEDFNLNSIRFFDGNFFVASKDGGFRIGLDGTVSEFSPKWTKDVFKWNNRYYATGFEDSDFYESIDNGLKWEKKTTATPLKIVTVTGARLFSQVHPGNQFFVGDAGFETIKKLLLNETFPDDESAYRAISFLDGNYYLTVGNDLYYTADIRMEE